MAIEADAVGLNQTEALIDIDGEVDGNGEAEIDDLGDVN